VQKGVTPQQLIDRAASPEKWAAFLQMMHAPEEMTGFLIGVFLLLEKKIAA
jgi:hypothetical protein